MSFSDKKELLFLQEAIKIKQDYLKQLEEELLQKQTQIQGKETKEDESTQYDICDILNLDSVEFNFKGKPRIYSYESLSEDFFHDLLQELNFCENFNIVFKFRKQKVGSYWHRDSFHGNQTVLRERRSQEIIPRKLEEFDETLQSLEGIFKEKRKKKLKAKLRSFLAKNSIPGKYKYQVYSVLIKDKNRVGEGLYQSLSTLDERLPKSL